MVVVEALSAIAFAAAGAILPSLSDRLRRQRGADTQDRFDRRLALVKRTQRPASGDLLRGGK